MCGNLANRQPEEEGIMMTFTTVYHIGERLQLEGETENMGVCTKERERHDSRGTHGHSLH